MPYAALDPRLWDDEDFVKLSPKLKIVWIYLLAGPEATRGCPGLLHMGVGALAEGLRQSAQDTHAQLEELQRLGWVSVDHTKRLICVPKAPHYRPAGNANVIKGWWRQWRDLPESPLKYEHVSALAEGLTDKTAKTWEATFGTLSPRPGSPPSGPGGGGGNGRNGVQDGLQTSLEMEGESFRKDSGRVSEGFAKGFESLSKGFESGFHYKIENPVSLRALKSFPNPSGRIGESFRKDCHPESAIRDPESEIRNPKSARATLPASRRDNLARKKTWPAAVDSGLGVELGLWQLQEQLRASLPGAPPPTDPRPRDLERVAAAVEALGQARCEHALRVMHRDAVRNPDKARFLDGVLTWCLRVLECASRRPIAVGSSQLTQAANDRRRFAGGEVEL